MTGALQISQNNTQTLFLYVENAQFNVFWIKSTRNIQNKKFVKYYCNVWEKERKRISLELIHNIDL